MIASPMTLSLMTPSLMTLSLMTLSLMTQRPKISWSDLPGSTVGIWGLGVEGDANLRRLRSLGVTPVLVDDRPPVPTIEDLPVLATAEGGLEALGRCEVVIKTPGISRHRPEVGDLEGRAVSVVGGLGLWMEEADRERVVCVTGTKGKSTTAAVTGHLLGRLGHRVMVGGNIGRPPWDPEVGTAYDFWIVETSSFQATDLASSPPVVAVTSLSPDHLDWHGDTETYYREKLSACTQSGPGSPWPTGTAPSSSPIGGCSDPRSVGSKRTTRRSTATGSRRSVCWAGTTNETR